MQLRHAAGSPIVRKAMLAAHEHRLVDRVGLVPTSVSPVQAMPAAGGYSLIVILLPGPSNGKSLSKTPFSIATHPAVGARS